METGKLIKELRIKKGMTQEELADKTEVSARTIQRIENGEVDPRAYTLQMIAKALNVDYSLFLENRAEKKPELQRIDVRNWSALIHLSGIIPLIFPTLILGKNKKDNTKEMTNHFHAAVIMQLCILGICLVGLWIYWNVNQPIPLIGGLLVGALISIANTIFVLIGKPYINPFIKSEETRENIEI